MDPIVGKEQTARKGFCMRGGCSADELLMLRVPKVIVIQVIIQIFIKVIISI